MTNLKKNSIPEELKQVPSWCCYKLEPDNDRPGKLKKIPKNAKTGGNAQSNNIETWSTYEEAVVGLRKYKFSGIGFMFSHGYFGVDIDNVEEELKHFNNGDTNNIIYEFINVLGSYAEYSVSRKGIHIICKGTIPEGARRKANVEMYQSGRFFTMSAAPIGQYTEIAECTDTIKILHEKYLCSDKSKGMSHVRKMELDETELISLASNSNQGSLFTMLHSGNWQGYYPSQSEADMAFCNILAFWCACDYYKMDSIMRASGLFREKWDRKLGSSTYGATVINKAIRDCKDVYNPKKNDNYSISIGSSQKKVIKSYTWDDTGNAQRFLDLYGDEIKYNYTNKQWMYYDGRKWCDDVVNRVKVYADKFIIEMNKQLLQTCDPEDKDAMKAIQKHIKSARSSKGKTNFIKEAEHMSPIQTKELDTEKLYLNTPSGILDMKTGNLIQHNNQYLLSKISYTEYVDNQKCDKWIEFLDVIFMGNKELIRYIQKAVGYSLSGLTSEQVAFFLYGTGGNGKGVFMEVISHIAGTYTANIQAESIMMKNSNVGQANSDIARLAGARLVVSSEPNEGVKLNEGLLKQLTGEDTVTARRLYGNEFEFKPQFKLWLSTNHKPIITGTDNGIWRRMRLIPFSVEIPEDKRDTELKAKLLKESSGILKWAIDGFSLYLEEGLIMPNVIKQSTAEYRAEMDVVGSFIDEHLIQIEGAEVQAKHVYEKYKSWASDNNEYLMTNTKFGREMGKRFEKTKTKKCTVYLGVKLKPEETYKCTVNFGGR